MVIQNKQLNIFIFTGLFLAASLVPLISKNTSAYAPLCVSAACHAAADKEAAASQRASAAAQNANDVAGMVAALDADLAAKEAEIAVQKALADDLGQKINQTSAELERDQAGLAKLLVKNHFDKAPSTISLLASSATIGELSSAEARQETVRDKINAAVKQVSDKKNQIAKEKEGVDSLLNDMNAKAGELATQRANRSATVAKYQADASAAKAEMNEASKKVAQEIAMEAAKYNSGGQTGGGGGGAAGNTYPYRFQCPYGPGADNLGYPICQCTSYAAYKANERWGSVVGGGWGNAKYWAITASGRYRVDNQPAPHTVAVSQEGIYGHVMWVEGVNGGTINISEYNNWYSAGHPEDYGTRYNVPAWQYQYIHFD